MGATPVNVRLTPNELAKLDAWIAANDPKMTRPGAIRAILEKAT